MLRFVAVSLFLAPFVVACGGVEPSEEEKMTEDELTVEQVADPTLVAIQTCLTQAPDATMTLGPDANGHHFGSVESAAAAYSGGFCSSFVVDITAPGGWHLPNSSWNYFSIRGAATGVNITQYSCDNAYESIKIYRKSKNIFSQTWSAWSLVDSDSGYGVWSVDPDAGYWCALPADGVEFEAPSLGITHVYRVLFTPKLYDIKRDARVSWSWHH